jgi:IclR family acetate operon transcriptional repressor
VDASSAGVRILLYTVHDMSAIVYNALVASEASGVQAVDRALSILSFFDERTSALAIGEVAEQLGVHRSTASRLLAALERHGLLESTGGGYRLGLGVVSLAGLVLNRFPARAIAHDVLRELRDTTGETAYLGLLDGHEVVYIDQASSPHVAVNADWVGYRQPLTEGASGALLLAYQPSTVIEEVLLQTGGRVGRDVPTELDLAAIRRRGYLVRVSEDDERGAGVAAPVRDHRGAIVAALAVWGPRHRVEERLESELVPAVLRAAALVSEGLGYRAA